MLVANLCTRAAAKFDKTINLLDFLFTVNLSTLLRISLESEMKRF